MKTNEVDLERLKGLESKATPGPWRSDFDATSGEGSVIAVIGNVCPESGCLGGPHCMCATLLDRIDKEDAEFIAEVRNQLPLILSGIERLERCLEQAIRCYDEQLQMRWECDHGQFPELASYLNETSTQTQPTALNTGSPERGIQEGGEGG